MTTQISENIKMYETRVAKIWMGKDGIVRNEFFSKVEVTLSDAIEISKANMEISSGRKTAYLIDARKVKSATREVREFGSRPETIDLRKASAILVKSPLSIAIGMLFIKLSHPPYPTRLFTSETDAIAWLRGF